MARFSASFRTTNAPTSTLPGGSLYAAGTVALNVVEVHIFNSTATACSIGLIRLTSAGTQGSGVTAAKFDSDSTSTGTAKQSHTSTGPTITDEIARADLGAAIGSNMIWTFDAKPIRVAPATSNGIGLIAVAGVTGQILDVVFVWDE